MTLLAPKQISAVDARAALADEWNARAPRTAAEVLEFYRRSECLRDDLDAFHTRPDRQRWTGIFVHLAQNVATHDTEHPDEHGAKVAIDIGSGAGHDLRALRDAGIETVIGVEPNDMLSVESAADGFTMFSDVAEAPIEEADLLGCFDVLEHVPDPETWLGNIAARAKLGCILVETCATNDLGTPLHLRENVNWRAGRCLGNHGWVKIGEEDRIRIWRRHYLEKQATNALIVCAYRSISLNTVHSMMKLVGERPPVDPYGWHVNIAGEAGLNRARSIAASKWWTDTSDDVFLMVDDDIVFQPSDAEKLVDKCRAGYDIVCAAYPVRDGGHLALRGYDDHMQFHMEAEALEIRWGATGFMAVHRRVLDKIIPTLQLCHEAQPWAFWPIFDFRIVEDEHSGGHNYLSEDWNFCELAREHGFKVWLDPSIRLGHMGMIEFSILNMTAIHDIVTGKGAPANADAEA